MHSCVTHFNYIVTILCCNIVVAMKPYHYTYVLFTATLHQLWYVIKTTDYCIADRKFGEFGKLSVICQTKTIQISSFNE